ncbi:alpha/beta fold hydrolase [Aestuariivirga sp.]|uniref:alpha/beta fold hydrolase n=1 Tax=Aestuariivirga sp. TaxID=2650926 RepID=UPI00391ACA84
MSAVTPRGTAYDVHGGGEAAVVLVHGLGLNRRSWQWQVPALARDYRVITYDLHGHGESSPPPGAPSLTLFSEQLRELLDHLGIGKAAVLGFSLGGMIARRFAMDHPQRLWAIGILHSAHARDKAAHDAIQARVVQAAKDGPGATVEAALGRWFTDAFRRAQPGIMDEVRGWILANRREVYAPIYQVLVDGVTELVAPTPPIACPALVMTGDEDYGNSPEMSRAIAAEIPGSELVILPGLRHMALAEAPDLFTATLAGFLARARRDG